jgi:hypothetical protein
LLGFARTSVDETSGHSTNIVQLAEKNRAVPRSRRIKPKNVDQ